jgi:hypothetical protein
MNRYRVPGLADSVSQAVLDEWNRRIGKSFSDLNQFTERSFLKRSPADVPNGQETTAVKWPGDPAEPRFCIGEKWAEKLSNWGVRGRHEVQNEYLEFGLIFRADATGALRPKRFVATTELREYWVTLAVADPEQLARSARDVLGHAPAWSAFYGPDVSDPMTLSPRERELRFSMYVAGRGQDAALPASIPDQPLGDLNRQNVLFMSHPINGLDDLIYVVAFGAYPYGVLENGKVRRARLHEIFIAAGVQHLACRNADPAAARGAFDQVYKPHLAQPTGCKLAFADPLGMYIRSFNTAGLNYKNAPVPAAWTRKRRGAPGMEQRLEFGPPDEHPAFLDDIDVEEGNDRSKLQSAYRLARRIEVGPTMVVGQDAPHAPATLEIIAGSTEQLNCSQAKVCERMRALREEYEKQATHLKPRGML